MLMGVRERDCYWKSEGICFETLQMQLCKYSSRRDLREEPALPFFLYDFVYRLYWDF